MRAVQYLALLRARGIELTVQSTMAPNDLGRLVPVKWLWAQGPMLPADWERLRPWRPEVVSLLEDGVF